MAGDNMLIEDDEDIKGGKPQEVEFVPVTTKQGDDRDDEDDDGDSKEDSRLSEDNEDREELRRKRREEKTDRAARRKQAIERDKTELNFLRQRNEALEKRMFNVEKSTVANTISGIDARIQDSIAEVKAAERIMAQATEAGNGEDVVKAMRIRDQAMQKVQQLQVHKHQQNQAAQQLHEQSQAPDNQQAAGPDPDVANFAKQWVDKNKWYKPNGNDEASKIVLAIDQSLVEAGYNPKTEEYWQELDKRVARRLPEHKGGGNYDDSQDDDRRGQRRGPPVGSSRDQAPQSTRREVYISPERKQAMTDAGVWEDPVLRQRYLKQYAKWDRENNSSR
jgi:hypothetical protein